MKKLWEKIKGFIIRNYIQIINWIVLILVYANTKQVGIETLVGLWIFAQIGIAGWKWFKKSNQQ